MMLLHCLFFAIILIAIREANTQNNANYIVGGTAAVNGQLPYQVSLRESNGIHYCGGAIIGAKWVVTSARCVFGKTPLYVQAGSVDRATGGVRYNVANTYVHPYYQALIQWNDIALIKTVETITFDANVAAIPLADSAPADNSSLLVSGWGSLQNNGAEPSTLQVLNTTVMQYLACIWKIIPVPLTPFQLCTYTKVGEGFCSSDIGGPLVANGKLFGIVSFVYKGCASGYPDVSTKIASHSIWIWLIQSLNK